MREVDSHRRGAEGVTPQYPAWHSALCLPCPGQPDPEAKHAQLSAASAFEPPCLLATAVATAGFASPALGALTGCSAALTDLELGDGVAPEIVSTNIVSLSSAEARGVADANSVPGEWGLTMANASTDLAQAMGSNSPAVPTRTLHLRLPLEERCNGPALRRPPGSGRRRAASCTLPRLATALAPS